MTDRYSALIVVLDSPLREDDAESLIVAVKQLRGVIDVRPLVQDAMEHVAYIRAWNDIKERVLDTFIAAKP